MNDRSKSNLSRHVIEVADQQTADIATEPLIQAIRMIADDHQVLQAEISLAIVDDPTIRQLNKQYLNHDYETDVISFVLDWEERLRKLSGQLIVSTDTAAELASDVGGSTQDEVLLYVVHGMLHLVGYDDKAPQAAAEMRRAERLYLSKFNVPHRGFSQAADDNPVEGKR